jgi:hypothetical protein
MLPVMRALSILLLLAAPVAAGEAPGGLNRHLSDGTPFPGIVIKTPKTETAVGYMMPEAELQRYIDALCDYSPVNFVSLGARVVCSNDGPLCCQDRCVAGKACS